MNIFLHNHRNIKRQFILNKYKTIWIPMKTQFSRLVTILFLLFSTSFSAKGQLPPDFYDTVIENGFELATGIVFDDLGRGYLWEKSGVVYMLDTTGQILPQPLIDIQEEVGNWDDHGLNYFCLDKDFLQNGRFYLFYVLDLHHYNHFGTSTYHPDSTTIEQATIGRITRYEADLSIDSPIAIPSSRTILLGETLDDGIPILYPFHGIGTLIHTEDGTLLLSSGDATSNIENMTGGNLDYPYTAQAISAEILTADQDIGSYRSQYVGSQNGKILRLDSDTGNGLPSNPYYDATQPRSAQSRIWNMGLRNPYRFTVRPNTGSHSPDDATPGTLYIGDVGRGGWEELNISTTGGQNFGWPIYEGLSYAWNFWNADVPLNQLAPNPIANCGQDYFDFRQMLATTVESGPYLPSNPCDNSLPIPASVLPQYAIPPVLTWNNLKWNQPMRTYLPAWKADGTLGEISLDHENSGATSEIFEGYSSLSGVFYGTGNFPDEYHNKLFAVDFSGWIKVMDFDENHQLHEVSAFHDEAKDIIHLAYNAWDGALYYTNLAGELRKISYGGNPAPVAIIHADQTYGSNTLMVNFSATQSYDPNQTALTYDWDFGDGAMSSEGEVTHQFSTTSDNPQSFTVRLTVTDEEGAVGFAEKIISLNNSPPQVNISSFQDGDQYPASTTSLLVLDANVTDTEHSDEELMYEWRVYLHHNYHFHPKPVDFEHRTHTLISPLGCDDEDYYYRIELTVTDPEGLKGFDSRSVYPYCGDPFINWINLELLSSNDGVALEWGSNFENEVASFEIQRSPDFFNFQTTGSLSPVGQSNTTQFYDYFDMAPPRGGLVYRIKATTVNGAYAYSNMAATSFPKHGEWNVFPNPAGTFFYYFCRRNEFKHY